MNLLKEWTETGKKPEKAPESGAKAEARQDRAELRESDRRALAGEISREMARQARIRRYEE